MNNVRVLQRNVKNVVKNYTEAQVKVREATSNDPWGPTSSLMAEIADLTHNVVASSEIMQMIWKRLNDHGKNWRHVYKALSLLDYLIKTGSEKVAQQCRENIYAIETLKDFQYIEENKDHGLNVREKSKALVALVKDEEKLRTERTRALKAKERLAQSVSRMSNSASMETLPKTSSSYHEGIGSEATADSSASAAVNTELEQARPQTIGEEELQLQLALAMSKEEAEAEERQRKNDDLRLQLALTESEKEKQKKKTSAMDDLLSIDLVPATPVQSAGTLDIWGAPLAAPNSNSTNGNGLELFGVAGGTASNDPWAPANLSNSLPNAKSVSQNAWGASSVGEQNDIWAANEKLDTEPASNDPWSTVSTSSTPANDPWTVPSSSSKSQNSSPLSNAFGVVTNNVNRKTPESFLGPNSNLVNLDALVSSKTNTTPVPMGSNPFAASVISNPFQAAKPPPPTINQLRSQTNFPIDALNGSVTSSFAGLVSSQVPPVHQPPLNPLIFNQQVTQPTRSSPNNPFAM